MSDPWSNTEITITKKLLKDAVAGKAQKEIKRRLSNTVGIMVLKKFYLPVLVIIIGACLGLGISQAKRIYEEVHALRMDFEAHKEAYEFIETWERGV